MSFKELHIFDKVTSWPQLISNLLVAPACLQCRFWLGPHFFTPQVFLFSISLLFVNKYYYFIEAYMQILLWSLVLRNSSPQFFLTFTTEWYMNIHWESQSLCKWFFGVQVKAEINLQCNNLSQTHSSVFFKLKTVWQVEHTWGECWIKFGWNPSRLVMHRYEI